MTYGSAVALFRLSSRQVGRIAARYALRALTSVVPLFIAACYGVPGTYRHGKVIDRATKAGVAGMVECLDLQEQTVLSTATTTDPGSEGMFSMATDGCAFLRASDTQHAYQTATVPLPSGNPLVIELEKAAP
jgi:hypothetical protein